jgi:methionyl-tRNA synthetase
MVEEGRFAQSNVKTNCKKCGKEIIGGLYCEACLSAMQENLQSVQEKISAQNAAAAAAKGRGMHSKTLGKK